MLGYRSYWDSFLLNEIIICANNNTVIVQCMTNNVRVKVHRNGYTLYIFLDFFFK